jgi:hypothetical protein
MELRMLDRVKTPSQAKFETAFEKWWDAQPSALRDCVDYSVARNVFRGGYASGRHADLDRYVFRAGRFRITVWAKGLLDAKKKAIAEADFRAARNGWKSPKSGWSLRELRSEES